MADNPFDMENTNYKIYGRKVPKKEELPMPYMCGRCGNSVNPVLETMDVRCASCVAVQKMETSATKGLMDNMQSKLNEMTANFHGLSKKNQELTSERSALESAVVEESQEKLKVRKEREHARFSNVAWRGFYDHWKARHYCEHCKNEPSSKIPCPVLVMNEQNALSLAPTYTCEECERRANAIALYSCIYDHYVRFIGHLGDCRRCMENRSCDVGYPLRREFEKSISLASRDDAGKLVSEKLKSSIDGFSFLGDGGAIMYDEKGEYIVLKIDLRKMKLDNTMILGVGDSPRAALEVAKRSIAPHVQSPEIKEVTAP